MQKVCSAIQWVDDPEIAISWMAPAFLGEKSVVRISLSDGFHNRLFGAAVDLAHEILVAFGRDAERVYAVDVP